MMNWLGLFREPALGVSKCSLPYPGISHFL